MYKEFHVIFHKGLRKNGSSRFFEDGECSIAQDCYFDETGNIFSRKFMVTITEFSNEIKTIFPYNYTDELIVLAGSVLCKQNGNTISTGFGSGKMSCVEYDNVLYIVNGTSKKRYDGINIQDIGNDEPTTAPTISLDNLEIADCNSAWTASSDVSTYVDEHDYQSNPDDSSDIKSIRLEINDAFATGIIGYRNITSKDLSDYTHIGCWIKTNKNINAGVIELVLDNTAACVSPLENLDIPAISINEWQWVVLELSDPSLLTAVVSVGLNVTSDIEGFTVRIDRIIAITEGELDGAYYYKYTYVDSNGKESNYSPISSVVNCKSEQNSVTVTETSDSKISYINLYRLGGTLTDWYYVTQVSNATQAITDNNADSDLSALGDAEYNDPPSSGLSYIVEHYERLIGAKTTVYPHSIEYSVEYEPEYWGEDLSQQYLISNKDACTGLLSWGRYVIFCKKKHIFVMEGSNPNNWHKRKSDSTYGNIAPLALMFYKMPIFLSWFGLCFFDGNKEILFSENVREFFDENRNYLSDAVGCVYDDKCYLSLPGASNVLVYDFISKIFYTYSLQLRALRYSYLDGFLYAGNNDYNLVRMEQDSNDGSYDTVNLQIKSKAYPLNDTINNVGNLRNYIISLNTKGENVTFNIYIDETLKQTITLNTSSMTRLRKSFDATLKGKFVEFEFVYTGTKQIEIETPILINPKNE